MSALEKPRRVALVTGAAGDLGSAIALRLAADGLDVAITDLPACDARLKALVQQLRATNVKACSFTGDVTNELEVVSVVDAVVAELGGLDVMVANAGICTTKVLLDTTVEDWDATMAVNARGVMLCYKAAAKQMIKQGRGGRIVGACSVAGLTGYASAGSYVASKFAVRGLTMTAALEWGPYNITVNAYAPGLMGETKMVDRMMTEMSAQAGLTPEVYRSALESQVPLKETGKAERVAGLVSYFASEDASWTTGKIYAVDGGLHMG